MSTQPLIDRPRSLSALWILPAIALLICCWLLYSSYRNAGVEITISFKDASGITAGKTRVVARGIPVGLVTRIVPDLERKQIQAVVKIDQSVAGHLVDDTQFWVVRPELSASSIQGLDTIFSGSYINVQVGSSTTPRRQFTGLASAPPVSLESPGLHLQLRAESLGSIQVGTGIYYRDIAIGSVQRHQLERDEYILIDLYIEPQFAHLIREGSRFCNASGMQISGKLPNLKIQVASLASLLRGGILLHTPEPLQMGPAASNGQIFPLYPDYDSANYGIPMTLTLASSEDIIEGVTKVVYRGLEAGFVKEITINDSRQGTVNAHILLDPRAEMILREGTRFWLVKPEISPTGFNNLRMIFAGAQITFQPGEGAYRDHFDILPEAPPQPPLRPGRSFVLESVEAGGVFANSPVSYKNVKVGEVIDVTLAESGEAVLTTIFMYEEYLHLLCTTSVFWVESGVEFSARVDTGVSFSTSSLPQLLHGGISFLTNALCPPGQLTSPAEGRHFHLHPSAEAAQTAISAQQAPGRSVQLIAEQADSLAVGSPLLFKNVAIGRITGFSLTDSGDEVLIDCLVNARHQHLISDRTRFYNLSGVQLFASLDGVRLQSGSLQSILTGGIGCYNPTSRLPSRLQAAPFQLYASLADAEAADEMVLTISLQAARGLKTGAPLRYQGVDIGRISKLDLAADLRMVTATVRVGRKFAELFRRQTSFWVEEIEITPAGVDNLETVVFGSFLTFLPGGGDPARNFIALSTPPRTALANRDGLGIILESSNLGSLTINSPVYYRRVEIGRVTGWQLSPTFQKVQIFVTIEPGYRTIIRQNSKFWKVSGTRITGGIFAGLTVSTESLASLVRGGIALATPDNGTGGVAVADGYHFTLQEESQKEWLDWSPDIVLLELEQNRQVPEQASPRK